MSQVEVRLYGALRDYRPAVEGLPHHSFAVPFPAPISAAALAQQLRLPQELVVGVAINGRTADLQTIVQPDDQVSFFPPTAGG